MCRAAVLSTRGFPQDKLLTTAGLELLGRSRKGSVGKKGETFLESLLSSPECKSHNITRSVKVSKMCPGWLVPKILPSLSLENSDSLIAQGYGGYLQAAWENWHPTASQDVHLQEIGFFLSHRQEEAETILFIPHSGVTAIQIEAKGPHIIWKVPVNIITILFLFFQIILIFLIGLSYCPLYNSQYYSITLIVILFFPFLQYEMFNLTLLQAPSFLL